MEETPRGSGFKFSWKWAVPVGCAVILACGICVGGAALYFAADSGLTNTIGRDIANSNATPATPAFALGNMQALIDQQGGKPCEENDELTCVTIQAPLDHFDSSETRTLDITFGIHPARKERKGMYAQAFPGGPGGEGISSSTLDLFSDSILDYYDIVFFDQRGVGLSSELDCPTALATYFDDLSEDDTQGQEGLDTPAEQEKEIDRAATFVKGCIAEMGIPAEEFRFYGTDQVAEDIETFRQRVGDDQFYLYGVSYGTAVAQVYAADHPDRLAGLVLDGTIDLTLDTPTTEHNQEQAFEKALLATFDACKTDAACLSDFGGADPLSFYDELAAKLADKPIDVAFPLPDGTSVHHPFTVGKLEAVSSFMMYSTSSRMFYLRAMAAAHRGDFVPLSRLLYARLNYDPATEQYVGDPTFSYSDFFVVNCADDVYYSGTPDEKVAQIIKDGQASNGIKPRLDGNIYSGLVCAQWPSQPAQTKPQSPLVAKGVPTLVLNATLDPATPFEGGKAVFESLDSGYHVYVEGGQHSIIGNDETCPDDIVSDFLVFGRLPTQKVITCHWDSPVMWNYLLPVAADAKDFEDLKQSVFQTEIDMILMPEHLYNSKKDETIEVACPVSGKFSFIQSQDKKEKFTFTDCAFSKGFVLNGTGSFDIDTAYREYNWQVSGYEIGELNYIYDSKSGITLQGVYAGKAISP